MSLLYLFNFLITALDTDIVSIEADYTVIHFSLQYPEMLDSNSIHVYGNFNGFAINDSTKLNYNSNSGFYETTLTLKQGFYNYQYVTKNKQGIISNYDIDGSFYETENDYTVLVYFKKFGSRYTEVIGVGYGNSEKINN